MKAELIGIGDEILIGQVVNTNGAWMGEELTRIGIEVVRNTVIADKREEIMGALDERADLVIMTGGIGPTKDDITKSTLAEYFGSKMVQDEMALERVQNILRGRVQMNELNIAQAMLPDNCRVIPNHNGTASGMWFEKDGTQYISLPGVPYEMNALMSDYILPALNEEFILDAIVHKTLLVQGIAESHLAVILEEYEETIPPGIKLAYLPSPGRIRLRLTASGEEKESVEALVDQEMKRLIPFIPQGHIYGYGDEQLEILLGKLLKEKNVSLALAESCTGGTIAQLITSVP